MSASVFDSLFGQGSNSEKTQTVEGGRGKVSARTIQFGDDVIVVPNIGSLFIVTGVKDVGKWILLLLVSIPLAFLIIGFLTGAFAIYKLLTAKPDLFLSIGTSDGKRLNLKSKDRLFLERVLQNIRDKIDSDKPELIQGVINVDNRSVALSSDGGAIAIGDGSMATGRQSLDGPRTPQ